MIRRVLEELTQQQRIKLIQVKFKARVLYHRNHVHILLRLEEAGNFLIELIFSRGFIFNGAFFTFCLD